MMEMTKEDRAHFREVYRDMEGSGFERNNFWSPAEVMPLLDALDAMEAELDRLKAELERERYVGSMATQALEGCVVGCQSERRFYAMIAEWEEG